MATTTVMLLLNNDITKETILGGNIDVDRYVPAIKTYQKTKLKPLLGTTLYNKICADFKANTLSGIYLEMYDEYIKDLVIQGSTENYLQSGAYMVSNNGITKMKTETSETIEKEEVDYLVEFSRRLYREYERQFLEWIKENGSSISEYVAEQPLHNNTNRINVGGWLLKKVGGCCK